jgi:hypothetical protein
LSYSVEKRVIEASQPDPAQAWMSTAGSAGQADPGELEEILAGRRLEEVDSGLERAVRAP